MASTLKLESSDSSSNTGVHKLSIDGDVEASEFVFSPAFSPVGEGLGKADGTRTGKPRRFHRAMRGKSFLAGDDDRPLGQHLRRRALPFMTFRTPPIDRIGSPWIDSVRSCDVSG
ncbi:hypothetical protein MRX96_023752 [Rhipicephalus microplus]